MSYNLNMTLSLSTLGKNFSRQFFYIFFPRIQALTGFSQGDNLHEMSNFT